MNIMKKRETHKIKNRKDKKNLKYLIINIFQNNTFNIFLNIT